MPEWVGVLIKVIGSVGTAVFGFLALGAKPRDEKGDLTPQGRTALIGIIVSAAIGSAGILYDYSITTTKEQNAELKAEESKYPVRGMSSTVRVTFVTDFPALRSYKEKLRKALPVQLKDCPTNPVYQCIDSDDDGETYRILPQSRLYPKRADFVRTVLDNLLVEVSFIKPGAGQGNLSFHRLGSFSFFPLKYGAARATLEFKPFSGALYLVLEDVPLPDEVFAHSDLYSLAEAFPGVLDVGAIVATFPTICSTSAASDCMASPSLKGIESVRVDELILRIPNSKAIRMEYDSATKCHSESMGHDVVFELPESIHEIDSQGNFNVASLPAKWMKDICPTVGDPAF